ncbi:MAG: ribosomal protein S18-alanine N-acetyltransferase [Cypionkella sp.]|nr:ribosomal protein S18-alanine N-acetyltransferase [Cypionkella sp.]
MTGAQMEALHRACFTVPRPWSAAEFSDLRASPLCFVVGDAQGFAMGRVVAGEAELLTLAVDPLLRRHGIGTALVQRFVEQARKRGGEQAFLEVVADNEAAKSLYLAAGFAVTGVRRGYYHSSDGSRRDALIMTRTL